MPNPHLQSFPVYTFHFPFHFHFSLPLLSTLDARRSCRSVRAVSYWCAGVTIVHILATGVLA